MDQIDGALMAMVEQLKKVGKTVYLVLDNPFGEEIDPHSMLRRTSWRSFEFLIPPDLFREVALARTEPFRSRIVRIANLTGTKLIDPLEYLCGEKICPAFSPQGDLLYKDYDHLSFTALINNVRYLDAMVDSAAHE
jgi:SGNH domain (fused to AT3 domains)